MAGAFQPDAFQPDAFQLDGNPTFTADAVLYGTVLGVFTADAELAGAVTGSTFTADAYFNKTLSATFTADSILTLRLVQDDFNRTTSAGEVGQPSIGRYVDPDIEDTGHVTGDFLESAPDFWLAGFKYEPATPRYWVEFDFRIVDADSGGGYQIIGPRIQAIVNPTFIHFGLFEIFEDGSGVWELRVAGNNFHNFTPTENDWWHAKGYMDLRSGGSTSGKVWKVGDPEPSAWQVTSTQADWLNFVASSPSSGAEVYIYSGFTDGAAIDNLRIEALVGSDIRYLFHASAALLKTVSSTKTANAVLKGTISATFSADAEFVEAGGTVTGAFNADSVLAPNTLNWTFLADALIVDTNSTTFTANARLVQLTTGGFIADAWIEGVIERTFTANAYIRKPEVTDNVLKKSVTISIVQRRPTALSAYVPPRNTDNEREKVRGGDPPDPECLPPCPGYPGGPGSPYGANGAVIRKTIVYCDNCGVWYYTNNNKLGIGSGNNSHAGCETSHSHATHHEARIFADYSAMPTSVVSMRGKLLWDISAPSGISVRVFANAYLPPLDDDEFEPWSSTWESDYWEAGNYIGQLSFSATDSSASEGVQWCDVAASLTVTPDALTTDVFRFEIGDLSQYYGAEFRAPNIPVTVD